MAGTLRSHALRLDRLLCSPGLCAPNFEMNGKRHARPPPFIYSSRLRLHKHRHTHRTSQIPSPFVVGINLAINIRSRRPQLQGAIDVEQQSASFRWNIALFVVQPQALVLDAKASYGVESLQLTSTAPPPWSDSGGRIRGQRKPALASCKGVLH
jgi:hypothetical protein